MFLLTQLLDSFTTNRKIGNRRNIGSFTILSVDAATVLDLSEDFPLADLYNANSGSDEMKALLDDSWKVLGFMVIDDGEVVAEHYASGEGGSKGFGPVWSCTKTVTALQVGMMEKEGLVSLSDTLGEIIAKKKSWKGISNKKARKRVTIEQLITMTAGLSLG